MLPSLPVAWRALLHDETNAPYFHALDAFLDAEIAEGRQILPARDEIFAALEAVAPEKVRVVLLGQDPYPTPGHAHGLCFSVQPTVRPIPGSLRNIYKELAADVGFTHPGHGFLAAWAEQGVLLLNTVLTVRAGEANSHQKRGWETFTDQILRRVNALSHRVVFVLWGRQAQTKTPLISGTRHRMIACAHPSPLSARLFLGCRCFSAINGFLVEAGEGPINWQLPSRPRHSTEENPT